MILDRESGALRLLPSTIRRHTELTEMVCSKNKDTSAL